MKVFTTVFFLAAFLVLIGMPEESFALQKGPEVRYLLPQGDHEEFLTCGPAEICVNTCERPHASEGACPRNDIDLKNCNQGYFCVDGYIRKYLGGPCILRKECLPRASN